MKRRSYYLLLVLLFSASSQLYSQNGALSPHEDIRTLNKLIETAKDAEQGYYTAAQAVSDPELRGKFYAYAAKRREFAGELERQVAGLGGKPAEDGSIGAALHRKWMKVKTALTGKKEKYVLAEIRMGESLSVEAYEAALQKKLGQETKKLVKKQAEEVKEVYREIKTLENKLEYVNSVEEHQEDPAASARLGASLAPVEAASGSASVSPEKSRLLSEAAAL